MQSRVVGFLVRWRGFVVVAPVIQKRARYRKAQPIRPHSSPFTIKQRFANIADLADTDASNLRKFHNLPIMVWFLEKGT